MEKNEADWYKKNWSMEIKQQSWTQNTKNQVDAMIKIMDLTGKERILDLACGFGRHSLEFARRGFEVVGVDITKEYIADAQKTALQEGYHAMFLQADIRDIQFKNEFDVVLNMADGAIGYLENETENEKIFQVISNALRKGGKHFMDIMNANYADAHFPCTAWDAGEKGLTLSKFEWDEKSKIMLYGQQDFYYGNILQKPDEMKGNPTRLYHLEEIKEIMANNQMQVMEFYGTFEEKPLSNQEIQMLVYSVRK